MLLKIVAVLVLCCALVLAQDVSVNGSNTPIEPRQSTEKPTPTPPPTPSSTTTKPTTTVAPHNGSTPVTTTPKPTVPTTGLPSTTLAPPTKHCYSVKEGNDTCLQAELAVQVKVYIENETMEFDIPPNASSNSSYCSNDTDELILSWEKEVGKNFTFTLQFAKNGTKFMVSQMSLKIPRQNETFLVLTNDEQEFTTTVSKSYRCEKEQEIKLSEEGTNTTYATLKISQLQLQAFHKSEDGKFASAEDCSNSSSPDIVPIAVGCALVVLIAIVLIAYLVGRRRSQARGYLSM